MGQFAQTPLKFSLSADQVAFNHNVTVTWAIPKDEATHKDWIGQFKFCADNVVHMYRIDYTQEWDMQLYTRIHSQLHCTNNPSLQSCQVPVVNCAAWGMSLLETSSFFMYFVFCFCHVFLFFSGVYPAGAASHLYVDYSYVGGEQNPLKDPVPQGSLNFTAVLPNGKYDYRYM